MARLVKCTPQRMTAKLPVSKIKHLCSYILPFVGLKYLLYLLTSILLKSRTEVASLKSWYMIKKKENCKSQG